MKPKIMVIPAMAGLGTLAGLIVTGCGVVRGGYEPAPYRVVRSSGHFQVREYQPLTVVETPMNQATNEDDGSFNRLFRFISGGNEAGRKIAMTTPVFMTGGDTRKTMAFVMPANMKPVEVPRPTHPSVTVRAVEGGLFAVLRYSGVRNAESEAGALERLRAWMKSEGLKEVSPPVYGYFDPPWTPAFLRRNEVMLRTGLDPQ
jgi:hypothetical protein